MWILKGMALLQIHDQVKQWLKEQLIWYNFCAPKTAENIDLLILWLSRTYPGLTWHIKLVDSDCLCSSFSLWWRDEIHFQFKSKRHFMVNHLSVAGNGKQSQITLFGHDFHSFTIQRLFHYNNKSAAVLVVIKQTPFAWLKKMDLLIMKI